MLKGKQEPLNQVKRQKTIKHTTPTHCKLPSQIKQYLSFSLNMEHPDQERQDFITNNHLNFKRLCCRTFPIESLK